MKPEILALYLPQYYPFKENDEWWGKGFTEWTNVGKAKPLWHGHYQPKVPADLGYYDLRVPDVREQQAMLAREAGVTGFLYWHYWFGNGKRIMSKVFQEVLESGKPEFPFALAWANHSWYKKDWQGGRKHDVLLMEQTYPGVEDARQHFDFLVQAFKDRRYVKIAGKPFFFVFNPKEVPVEYLNHFRQWTKEAGFPDIYLVANVLDSAETLEDYRKIGYDAITYNRIGDILQMEYRGMGKCKSIVRRCYRRLEQYITGKPRGAMDYGRYYPYFISKSDQQVGVIPQIFPNWDHSPRSGREASNIYYNARPEFFGKHVTKALEAIKDKPAEEQILILKSWNEWGEGNYMEPDMKYGHGYIDALREALNKV
jgi:lipopolysaccharide biosynthesis protein